MPKLGNDYFLMILFCTYTRVLFQKKIDSLFFKLLGIYVKNQTRIILWDIYQGTNKKSNNFCYIEIRFIVVAR